MADIVTNVLVFFGVYNLIADIWRMVEYAKLGRIEVVPEHTIICYVASLFIMGALYFWRVMV